MNHLLRWGKLGKEPVLGGEGREGSRFPFPLDVRMEISGRQLDIQSGIQGQDWA